jgi:hypothetical protein
MWNCVTDRVNYYRNIGSGRPFSLSSHEGYFCRFSKTSLTTGRAENAFGQSRRKRSGSRLRRHVACEAVVHGRAVQMIRDLCDLARSNQCAHSHAAALTSCKCRPHFNEGNRPISIKLSSIMYGTTPAGLRVSEVGPFVPRRYDFDLA